MRLSKLERCLASLLQYGTWFGSFVMTGGIVLGACGLHAASTVVTAGVGIIILLPVARLVLMLAIYLSERDYRFAGIAAFVLTVVLISCIVGIKLGSVAA